jgi:uncharacterized protein (TIGR02246 family)
MERYRSRTAKNCLAAREARSFQGSLWRWRIFRSIFCWIGWISLGPTSLPCVCAAEPGETETVQWDYDSSQSIRSRAGTAGNEVADALNRMTDQWNAHNLEGYLTIFWDSPKLSVITDGSVTSGYRELYTSYQRSYSDLAIMGKVEISSVKIRMVKADLALALSKWTFFFPKTNHAVAGVDTTYLRKFDFGWKIVTSHTTTMDL